MLITIEEAKTLSRPIGKVDNAKIESFIKEIEQTIIRQTLGDELYLYLETGEGDLPFDATFDYTFDMASAKIDVLKNGGTYRAGCDCAPHYFVGLKVAEAYFVYAQNIMSGDFESTRYGTVIKSGDYSEHISSRERSDLYNSMTAIAKSHLQDCVDYCRAMGFKIRGSRSVNTTTGCIIHKIG